MSRLRSSPDYELPCKKGYTNKPLNHSVLRDIRTIVEILRRGGPLRNFLQARDPIKLLKRHPISGDASIPVPNDDINQLFEAWVGIERVFGDLDDNRLHPNGWDELYFVFSGKKSDDSSTDLVSDNEGEKSDNISHHGVVGKLKYKGSNEEKNDVLEFYRQSKGDLNEMLEKLDDLISSGQRQSLYSGTTHTYIDKDRWVKDYIQPAIDKGDVEDHTDKINQTLGEAPATRKRKNVVVTGKYNTDEETDGDDSE